MLFPKFFIFISFSLLSAQTIPSLSYAELKPLLNQSDNKVHVVNFWATWCAPCIKELPYFEALNKRKNVEVLLVSLDFPKHKQSRLLPFISKNKLQSKVVLLDDADENYWINDINANWSGAIPATLIYNSQKRDFYERSFTKNKLLNLVESFNP
jgi:thiol-disulfide isomerase/thioredoxin